MSGLAVDIKPLADAVLAELRGTANLTVYDGHVPTQADGSLPSLPYVAVYMDTGDITGEGLDGSSNRLDLMVWMNTSGATADSVRIVSGKARGALLDKRLTVPGWSCWPIRYFASQPVRRDDDVTGQVVFLASDQYRLSADRA